MDKYIFLVIVRYWGKKGGQALNFRLFAPTAIPQRRHVMRDVDYCLNELNQLKNKNVKN
jgi:hypothetical protein